MEDILYVKVEQNMVVQKKTLTYEDIATLYCQNQNIVKKLNKEIFYTLDPKQQKTMFTIEKVYAVYQDGCCLSRFLFWGCLYHHDIQ